MSFETDTKLNYTIKHVIIRNLECATHPVYNPEEHGC